MSTRAVEGGGRQEVEQVVCPKCEEPKPRREFRVYDEKVLTCRACRARARARIQARDARDTIKLKARLDKIGGGRAESKAEKTLAQQLKFLKSRFLKVTGVHRLRIREMESKVNPSAKTMKALKKRKEILDRYEQAHELQQTTARVGGKFVSIEELIGVILE